MPEIGTSGLMSGDGKRGDGQRPQATAPILDSTICEIYRIGEIGLLVGLVDDDRHKVKVSERSQRVNGHQGVN